MRACWKCHRWICQGHRGDEGPPVCAVCPAAADVGVDTKVLGPMYMNSLPGTVRWLANMDDREFEQQWERANELTQRARRGGRVGLRGWADGDVPMVHRVGDAMNRDEDVQAPIQYWRW